MWWPTSIFSASDPLKDLDPTLREYLQKETPKSYQASSSSTTPSSSIEPQTYRDSLHLRSDNVSPLSPASTTDKSQPAPERPLPKESLFQDGRYAHLWRTYRPAGEVDAAGKSDQEKLSDIVAGYKDRREQVKHVALENCAEEQWAIHDCFKNGGWSSRMTMCRAENRSLERCVMMQGKFLRALGYLSPYARSQEETERIQMHADTLYHRMLDQEKAIEEAKARGEAPPVFEELVREERGGENAPPLEKGEVRPRVGRVTLDTMPKELQAKLAKERFEGLEGPALDLAKKELNQEIAANEAVIGQLEARWIQEKRDRMERRERGQERMSDKVQRWFDFRDWSAVEKADAQKSNDAGS